VAESVTGGSTPVPVRAMVWGELAALSVRVMDAVSAPPVAGAKWPWMEQLAPGARVVPQVLAKTKDEAFVPATAMLVMESATPLVLVRVMYLEALAVPTCWLPKGSLVAERDTVGPLPRPVPDRAMVCVVYAGAAALSALSVTTREPLRDPVVVGEKLTASVHREFGASDAGLAAPAATAGQAELTVPSSEKFDEILGLVPVAGAGKSMGALPMFSRTR